MTDKRNGKIAGILAVEMSISVIASGCGSTNIDIGELHQVIVEQLEE
jgi:hypothetical protein